MLFAIFGRIHHLACQGCGVQPGGERSLEHRSTGPSREGWRNVWAGWGHVSLRPLFVSGADGVWQHTQPPRCSPELLEGQMPPVERAVSLSALFGAARKWPFLTRARLYRSARAGACARAQRCRSKHQPQWSSITPSPRGRANTSASSSEGLAGSVYCWSCQIERHKMEKSPSSSQWIPAQHDISANCWVWAFRVPLSARCAWERVKTGLVWLKE